jgi:hypothetical protein
MERGLEVRIRVVFDHRPTVHGPRMAPIHHGRRLSGAFPYGDGRDISLGDEPDVRELSPQPLPRYEVAHLERLRLGMPYAQQAEAPRARTVLVMRLYQRMLATEMALGSDIMSNSVEGYQLLKLAGKSGGRDSLRKQLSVRFKSKRARVEPEEGGSQRRRAGVGVRVADVCCVSAEQMGPYGPICLGLHRRPGCSDGGRCYRRDINFMHLRDVATFLHRTPTVRSAVGVRTP